MKNPYMKDFSHANLCLRPKVCRFWKGMIISMKNKVIKKLLAFGLVPVLAITGSQMQVNAQKAGFGK